MATTVVSKAAGVIFDLISNTWDFGQYISYTRVFRVNENHMKNDICIEHFVFYFHAINNRLEFIPSLS